VSDDEDDTHPNIDTPSLFRWRHSARVERMEEQKKEREEFEAKTRQHKKKMQEVTQKLKSSSVVRIGSSFS
jgi:cell division cycle protein 37